MKGLKKAAGEAKRLPEGYHLEGWYNAEKDTLTLFDELLSGNQWKAFPLDVNEYRVEVYPGDTMEKIKARLYDQVVWVECLGGMI